VTVAATIQADGRLRCGAAARTRASLQAHGQDCSSPTQIQELYDAYLAGKLSVSPELATALSQIRDQLMAIKLDGSINPAAADQRRAARVQIVRMVPNLNPPNSSPPPPAVSASATATVLRDEPDRLRTDAGEDPAWFPPAESARPAVQLPAAQRAQSSASPSSVFQQVASATETGLPSPGTGYAARDAWARHQSEATRSRRPSRRVLITIGIVILCILGLTGGFMITSGGNRPGWIDSSLRVVGSPVTADGVVVVLDVSANQQLQLAAINPKNGASLWTRAFSASEITAGVAFEPTALGNTVLDLAPAAGSDDPSVTVEGLDAATGNVMWSVPQRLVLSDAPAVCGGEFCLAAYDSETTTALVSLDPATGKVVVAAAGPMRNMLVSPPGSPSNGGLLGGWRIQRHLRRDLFYR
jgi:hypothetical protein